MGGITPSIYRWVLRGTDKWHNIWIIAHILYVCMYDVYDACIDILFMHVCVGNTCMHNVDGSSWLTNVLLAHLFLSFYLMP